MRTFCFPPRELFPPLHDHIAIELVEFHEECFAIGLFGGEGVFFARLRGPGKVWIQSLPFARLAGRMMAAAGSMGGQNRGEGSVLGQLGNLIDGN